LREQPVTAKPKEDVEELASFCGRKHGSKESKEKIEIIR